MYAVSAKWAPALQNSHSIVVMINVLSGGQIVGTLAAIEPTSSVTIDKTQAIRRSCKVDLVDKDGTLTPSGPTSLLAPYGNELQIYRGIKYSDGTTETVPLGIFRIATVDIDDSGADVQLTVQGYDRSRAISRNKLTDPYVISSGTNVATAILALLQAFAPPSYHYNFQTTTATTPQVTLQAKADPWQEASNLATAAGMELFFDADGNCVLQAQPNPVSAPVVATYAEGPTSTNSDIKRSMTDEGVYNKVVRDGAGSNVGAPVRGTAQDNTPGSPTQVGGNFGTVVDFATDTKLTTISAANAAAAAQLLIDLGGVEPVVFTAIPNPAHDANDVIQGNRPRIYVTHYYVVDKVNMPLGPDGKMTLTTRLVIGR